MLDVLLFVIAAILVAAFWRLLLPIAGVALVVGALVVGGLLWMIQRDQNELRRAVETSPPASLAPMYYGRTSFDTTPGSPNSDRR